MVKKKSAEVFPGQRQKEKRALWGRYQLSALERHYKAKFFDVFGNRCFKCGAVELPPQRGKMPVLCVDHHVPMALGGHLEPGNLVVLCRRCNELKLDRLPEDFYTSEELLRLAPFLECQHEFFAFTFDWDAWNKDRGAYLRSLGLK